MVVYCLYFMFVYCLLFIEGRRLRLVVLPRRNCLYFGISGFIRTAVRG